MAKSFSSITPPSNLTVVIALLPRVPPSNTPSPSAKTTSRKPSMSLDLTALLFSLLPPAVADSPAMAAVVVGEETTIPMVDGVIIAEDRVTSLVIAHRVQVVMVEIPVVVAAVVVEIAIRVGSLGTLPENAEAVAVAVALVAVVVGDLGTVTTVVELVTWLEIVVRKAAALVGDSEVVRKAVLVVIAITVESQDILLGNALAGLRVTYSVTSSFNLILFLI